MKELKELQAERFDREGQELDEAARSTLSQTRKQTLRSYRVWLQFSTEEIERHIQRRAAFASPARLPKAA